MFGTEEAVSNVLCFFRFRTLSAIYLRATPANVEGEEFFLFPRKTVTK